MSKTLKSLKDVIDPKIKFVVSEAEGSNNPEILAKIKGVFFCPDGVSRNNRFYSRQLWENVLANEDVQERIKNKNMFGTIGHDTELNDLALQQGLLSHYMTNVMIDEHGQGIGEAVIMNTAAGRNLNTVLRAGATLYVSSRGEGAFDGEKNGIPAVDENNYSLIGWDFVLNPGFLKANPKIAESLEDLKLKENNEGDPKMNELLEKLSAENAEAKLSLASAKKESKELKESVDAISEENTLLKANVLEAQNAVKAANEELDAVKETLAKYEEFSTSPEKTLKVLEKFDVLMEEVGTPSEIVRALKVASLFKAKVDEIGSIGDIKATLKAYEGLIKETEDQEAEDHAKALSDKLGVDLDTIKGMISKGMSDEEIEKMTQKVTESIKAKMPKKVKTNESKFKKTGTSPEKVADKPAPVTETKSQSRLDRMANIIG